MPLLVVHKLAPVRQAVQGCLAQAVLPIAVNKSGTKQSEKSKAEKKRKM